MSVCCCGTCPDCVAYREANRARIAAIDTASAALRTKVQAWATIRTILLLVNGDKHVDNALLDEGFRALEVLR